MSADTKPWEGDLNDIHNFKKTKQNKNAGLANVLVAVSS